MRFGILLIMMLAFVGCGARDVERKAIGTANENNKVVAGNLAKKPETAPHARILDAQAKVVDHALDLTPEEKRAAGPTVDPVGLDVAPGDEAAKAEADADKAAKEVDAAQEASWFSGIFSWAGWGTVGLGLLWALHAAGDIIPALKPVQLVTGPILKRTPLVGRSIKDSEKLTTAVATIESSTVGRYALRAADKFLGSKYGEEVAKYVGAITGGKEATIEGLFTHVAQGHAVDHTAVNHADVKALLDEVKTHMPTLGGIPTAVANMVDPSPPDGSS